MEKETCEGIRGGNRCGREQEFYIEDSSTGSVWISCAECIGRILTQNEIDKATVTLI